MLKSILLLMLLTSSLGFVTRPLLEPDYSGFAPSSQASVLSRATSFCNLQMVKTAEKITDIYNSCDKEMVIAGCMLHDIGKIYELSTDNFGKSDYTIDGNLFGHLFIGAEIVKNKAKELGINNEITRCLIHIIVSHHENLEWGAITKPSTLEAFLVSQIDYIDANYIRIEDACSKLYR